MNKKNIIFVIIIVLVGIIFFFQGRIKKYEIILNENLSSEINSYKYIKDYIKEIRNGKIINLDQKIDTSKLGKTTIEVKILNCFGKEEIFNFSIDIIDTERPIIKYEKVFTVAQNQDIDLLEEVIVTDNSNEQIIATIEGEYDLDIPNTYKLYYVAKDSSGNETKSEFSLIVTEKEKSISTSITTKGFALINNNGLFTIDGIVITNKTYSLPKDYGNALTQELNDAFSLMKKAALKDEILLKIISGFRSYNTQISTYNYWVSQYGKQEADTISARPGHSEHQTGLAIDINSLEKAFKNTKEGIWLNENAYKFGFILRYPENKEEITGYSFEPWHYRYVGTELSYKLYNNGDWITIEEYYGITSSYE